MQKTPLSIGIDVSKDTLSVVLRFSDREEHLTVPNSKNGITALHRKLRSCSCPLLLESTGRYHILASFLLAERGYDVRLINPITAKRYITSSVRKKKTDKTDAAGLAQMGVTEHTLPPRFSLSKKEIQIRQKTGLLSSLETQLQSLRQMLHAYGAFQAEMGIATSDAESSLTTTVESLKKEKHRLQKEIQALILEDERMREKQELACSIPGISAFTGSLLSQVLSTGCVSPKQWIAFIGFDLSRAESGRWTGRRKLSKRGNPYLRKRLFGAAWGAVMHDERFRSYYDRLKAQGRKHREALVIIARKMLRIVFAVLKTGKPFSDELCLFPL